MGYFLCSSKPFRLSGWVLTQALVLSQVFPGLSWTRLDVPAQEQTTLRISQLESKSGLAVLKAGLEEWVGPVDPSEWKAKTDPGRTLIQSFSGIRAVVSDPVAPPVESPLQVEGLSSEHKLIFAKYAERFAGHQIEKFREQDPHFNEMIVVLARDPRPSGKAFREAQIRGMLRAGKELGVKITFRETEEGILPTPFAEGLVRLEDQGRRAHGGAILTASHNPLYWNGVKYMTAAQEPGTVDVQDGTLLPARQMSQIVGDVQQWIATIAEDPSKAEPDRKALNAIPIERVVVQRISEERVIQQMVGEARRMWGLTDEDKFRWFQSKAKEIRIVLDPNGGAATGFYKRFLEEFGFHLIEINNVRGRPQHSLEPVGDALGDAKRVLREEKAHLAVVFDYDADRGNTLISGIDPVTGEVTDVIEPRPQEVAAMNVAMTLARESWLKEQAPASDTRKFAVVMHDANSRRVEKIAKLFAAEVFVVEVGEVNVIEKMRRLERDGYRVVIGIEGANGGTVFRGDDGSFKGDTSRNGAMTALFTGLLLVYPEIGWGWLKRVAGDDRLKVPEKPTLMELLQSLPGERGTGDRHFTTDIWKQGAPGEVPEAQMHPFQEKVLEVWEETIRPFLESGRGGSLNWSHALLEKARILFSRETRIYTPEDGPEKYGGGLTLDLTWKDGFSSFVWMRGSLTEGLLRISVEAQGPKAQEVVQGLKEIVQKEWYPKALSRAGLEQDKIRAIRTYFQTRQKEWDRLEKQGRVMPFSLGRIDLTLMSHLFAIVQAADLDPKKDEAWILGGGDGRWIAPAVLFGVRTVLVENDSWAIKNIRDAISYFVRRKLLKPGRVKVVNGNLFTVPIRPSATWIYHSVGGGWNPDARSRKGVYPEGAFPALVDKIRREAPGKRVLFYLGQGHRIPNYRDLVKSLGPLRRDSRFKGLPVDLFHIPSSGLEEPVDVSLPRWSSSMLSAPIRREELSGYEALVEEIYQAIREGQRAKGGGQFRVAVSGIDASGKTTLMDRLKERIRQEGGHPLRLSESELGLVARSIRDRWRAQGDSRWGDYRNHWIRWENVQHHLKKIARTSQGVIRLRNLYGREHKNRRKMEHWLNAQGIRRVKVFPDAILLYSGHYPLDPDRYPPGTFDLQILLDATPGESLRRYLARAKKAGDRSPEEVRQLFESLHLRWKRHVETVQPEFRAHWVYDMTNLDRPVRLFYEKAGTEGAAESPKQREDRLGLVQEYLRQPIVTGGGGVRWRFLTGERDSYDQRVKERFPSELIPELREGLKPLLDRLERESSARGQRWVWVDAAGGIGAALKEARVLYSLLRPVLVDAVRWRPEEFPEKILSELPQQAQKRGIQDVWSMEGIRFIEEDISKVRLDGWQEAPIRLITIFQALGYSDDPLGTLVHLYNQLPDGGILLANFFVPTEHPRADGQVKFYRQILGDLKKHKIPVDLKVDDHRERSGDPMFELGLVLKKRPGSLQLKLMPRAVEPLRVQSWRRLLEYRVVFYEGDIARPFDYSLPSHGGLEEPGSVTVTQVGPPIATVTELRSAVQSIPAAWVPSGVSSLRVPIFTPDGLDKLLVAAWLKPQEGEPPIFIEAIAEDEAHRRRVETGLKGLGLASVRVHDLQTEFGGNLGEAVTALQVQHWQVGRDTLVVTALSGLEEFTRFLGIPAAASGLEELEAIIERSQSVWS